MPTYQKCPREVELLAGEVLCQFETHKPLLDQRVKIDYVFAFPDYHEETGERLNDALTHGGAKALGIARIIGPKDRALGRGDAEIALDGSWWNEASEQERRALLDHELHHIAVRMPKGIVQFDDSRRPKLWMRKHDIQFGWFNAVAARHERSLERMQAAQILAEHGQLYFPGLVKE